MDDSKLNKKEYAQKAYKELQAIYTDATKSNNDKANSFRIVYEQFIGEMNSDGNKYRNCSERLSEVLQKFVPQSHNVQKLARATLYTLNEFHHPNSELMSDRGLESVYQNLLTIIQALSGIIPDRNSLILAGKHKMWMVDGLNNEQKSAVVDDHPMIVVNAGPGTGKTYLLIRKMAYYLEQNKTGKVVSLSFTNAAADQLKKKSEEYFPDDRKIDWSDRYESGTIHSFCFTQLKLYNKSINQPFDLEIYDDSDLRQIAEDIAESLSLVGMIEEIICVLQNGGPDNDLTRDVENYKKEHHFIRVEEILTLYKKTFKIGTPAYFWLKENGLVDFLLVDEFQDLTASIYEVIYMLFRANPQMKMFFVGDPRQNIFAFNGGSCDNFTQFREKLGDMEFQEFSLVRTYRCPINVVNLVNELHFDDCKNQKLIPDENVTTSGVSEICGYLNEEQEANEIVGRVKSISQYDQTCIMCTGLWYLEGVARKLNQEHIPFVVKGGKRKLMRIIKLINYGLRVIDTNNENGGRRLDYYIRDFKESKLYTLLEERRLQKERGEQLYLAKLIQEIAINLPTDWLEGMNDIVKDYETISQNYDTISGFLFACASQKNDQFAAFYEQDFNVDCTSLIDGVSPVVTLSTIHSAKGLEWKNVFLAGISDDMIPSYKAQKEIDLGKRTNMLNDEKKKFYVAVTRSLQNLWLTYSTTRIRYGNIYPRTLSRFVPTNANMT